MRRACGFTHPPADGTPEREVMDRFAAFLREAPKPGTALSPAKRYRVHFLAWRVAQAVR